MIRLPLLTVLVLGAACGMLGACANGSDRYPSLSLRSFERIQGSFDVADSPSGVLRPEPLSARAIGEVAANVQLAQERHRRFLALAESARRVVAGAAGSNPEDKRWALAQVEIAELDSRRAGTAALLADLDQLYAQASLSFTERNQIEQAQSEVAGIVTVESRIVGELIDLLHLPGQSSK